MPSLHLDERLRNHGPLADLRLSHPALFQALRPWFVAQVRFDFHGLDALVTAASHEALAAAAEKGEAALAACPAVAATLDPVIVELEAAIAGADGAMRPRLEGLLESARTNRATFLGAQAAVDAARANAVDESVLATRATRVLEEAERRLDTLVAAAADEAAPYARLEPLNGELLALWEDVADALDPIRVREQRALRASFDPRMREKAGLVCRRLHAALSRDRASGAWPRPQVVIPDDAPHADSVAAAFALALACDDGQAAHAVLAPWLQAAWTPQRLHDAVVADLATTMTFYEGLTQAPAPATIRVVTNPLSYEDVAGLSGETLPPEVTADNFHEWHPVQILTDDIDASLTDWAIWCDLFVVTVQTPAGEKVGYFRIGD